MDQAQPGISHKSEDIEDSKIEFAKNLPNGVIEDVDSDSEVKIDFQ